MCPQGEVEEHSDESAYEHANEKQKRTGLPAPLIIDRLQVVRENAKQSLLEVRFRIFAVDRPERRPNLFRRDMPLGVHDYSTAAMVSGTFWSVPKLS